ncbi:MAG: ABC transporter ATP-binding protein [Candidatus Binatia bacterium]
MPAPSARSGEGASAPAIRVSGVRKRFRKFATRGQYTTLKSSLVQRLFGRGRREQRFLQVLDEIDFEVPRGRALGVIGPNGSGKSTLLKLVAGILKPDAGSIAVHGRISPLIELGAGFHPEFTGRENVYLNGIVLGLSRAEIGERFDAIVDFAGLRELIDDPVRTYSSGMYMRLGFSIAIHAAPDTLLIDEILAVGDQSFARKCEEWIAGFLDRGGTILLVSHDLSAVDRWCHEVLWLERGRLRLRGSPREVISRYVGSVDGEGADAPAPAQTGVPAADSPPPIAQVRIVAEKPGGKDHLRPGDPLVIEVEYAPLEESPGGSIELSIRRTDGVHCYATSTAADGVAVPGAGGRFRCRFPSLLLLNGTYLIDVAIRKRDGSLIDQRGACATFSVESGAADEGVARLDHRWELEPAGGGT